MAEEKVEIIIKSSVDGATKTKKDVEAINKGVKDVGKSSKTAEKQVSSLTSVLTASLHSVEIKFSSMT